jgi:hypothetical protein
MKKKYLGLPSLESNKSSPKHTTLLTADRVIQSTRGKPVEVIVLPKSKSIRK